MGMSCRPDFLIDCSGYVMGLGEYIRDDAGDPIRDDVDDPIRDDVGDPCD